MTEAKHTPGPWKLLPLEDDPYGDLVVVSPSGFHNVCRLRQDDAPVEDFNREQRANARLIAAAPDMLAVLKETESCFDALAEAGYLNEHRRRVWADMRTAIAKATGAA